MKTYRSFLALFLASGAWCAGDNASQPPVDKTADQPAQGQPSSARVDRFGDPLPARAIARLGTVRFRQGYLTYDAVFSPDGKTVASASAGQGVCLWEVATGRQLHQFMPGVHSYSVAFSPGGRLLATTGNGLKVWDVSTSKEIQILEGNKRGETMVVAFAPDGKTLATGGHDNLVRLWDVAAGKEIRQLKGHEKSVLSLAFSADGRRLLSAGLEDSVRVWDLATGKEIFVLAGHAKRVTSVAVSPDDNWLASASEDGSVRIWNPLTGKVVRTLKVDPKGVDGVAFSPDSRTLAAAEASGRVSHWEVAGGKKLQSWHAHPVRVQTVRFSPDGKSVVTTGGWSSGPRLWDLASGKPLDTRVGHLSLVELVAFEPDGKTLLSLGREGVLLRWDVREGLGKPWMKCPDGAVGRLSLSPDLITMASIRYDGGPVHLWDLASGNEVRTLDQPKFTRGSYAVRPTVFSPEGKRLATLYTESSVQVWDPNTGAKLQRLELPVGPLAGLAFSPDGKSLAAGLDRRGEDSIYLWNLATGQKVHSMESREPTVGLVFSPDGKWLVSSGQYGFRARLWNVETGQEGVALIGQSRQENSACAFSPDGRFLAGLLADRDSAEVVWEVLTGSVAYRFTGHRSGAVSACFAPDGRALVTGGSDSMILVWDLTHANPPGARTESQLTEKGLASLWDHLSSPDAAPGCRAVWVLAAAPRQSVPFLKERLHPVAPLGERQKKQIAAWIKDLDAEEFAARERATAELEKQGEPVVPLLKQALRDKLPEEAQRRVEQLLDKFKAEQVSPEQIRQVRSVQALEYCGTVPARQLLQALAGGTPDARLTREARAAMDRLGSKATTP